MKKSLAVVITLAVLVLVVTSIYRFKNKSGAVDPNVDQASSNSVDASDSEANAVKSGQVHAGTAANGAKSGTVNGIVNAPNGVNGPNAGPGTVNVGKAGESAVAGGTLNAQGSGAVAMAPVGDAANGVNGAQNPDGPVITRIPVQPNIPACARIKFQNKEKEFKVKRHELMLTQKIESRKDLCVTVNGEGVVFDLQKNTKIVFERRLKNKDAEVVATYCLSGACKLTCPKAKKDFFDEISGESSDEVIKGFAGDQSAEEKQLQRELASLQKLLKEPSERKQIIEWTESSRNEGPCSQVVQAKF